MNINYTTDYGNVTTIMKTLRLLLTVTSTLYVHKIRMNFVNAFIDVEASFIAHCPLLPHTYIDLFSKASLN